ncbi:hypothetical protein ON010_g18897 [Phytophthora cinnamomi]|nr:hypothetical protein ON010_g18897 [Phytophthora cinnamomi]
MLAIHTTRNHKKVNYDIIFEPAGVHVDMIFENVDVTGSIRYITEHHQDMLISEFLSELEYELGDIAWGVVRDHVKILAISELTHPVSIWKGVVVKATSSWGHIRYRSGIGSDKLP